MIAKLLDPISHDERAPPPPQFPPRARGEAASQRASPALVAQTEALAPNVLAITHWERLKSGALVATSPRVDWPTLMRRTFDVDVLECPKCNGRLRILAVIEDATLATQILDELAIPRAPPPTRARDPATLEHDPTLDGPC